MFDSATPWTVAYQAPLSVGILQAWILEWVAIPSSRGSFQPRDRTQVSHIAGRFFTIWATREAQRMSLGIQLIMKTLNLLQYSSLLPCLPLAFSTQKCIHANWDVVCMHAKSLQLCLTLCDPMDCSPPGSSVRGILQVRILQWVGMPFSRGSSWLRDQIHLSCLSCTGKRVLYH